MAHTDWELRAHKELGAHEPLQGCQASDLKGLLNTIVEQLTDADRRHTDTLLQMQDRLAGMGREARSLRPRVPDQFGAAFERIEAGMAELANRIAECSDGKATASVAFDAGLAVRDQAPMLMPGLAPMSASPVAEAPMALRSAGEANAHVTRRREEEAARTHAGIDTFDVIETSLPGNASDPWDRDSAEALAGIYETGTASFGSKMPSAEPQAPGPNNYVSAAYPAVALGPVSLTDQAWLETRFTELSQRLDASLNEIRPDQGFFDISQRIELVERHVAGLLDNVATHADVEGIRLIEAHVGELAGHLDSAHQQLVRLDTIEGHLAGIAEKLADVHRAALSAETMQPALEASQQPYDVQDIVHRAAEATAKRFADQMPRPQSSGSDEVHRLIERFMNESRQGEENTTALLDTLQQAMIRLLDRVDAMEMSHQLSLQAQAAPQDYVREHARFNTDANRLQGYADREPAYALDAAVAAVASAKSISSPMLHGQSDSGATVSGPATYGSNGSGDAPQQSRSSDKLRQDFIADARRAKMLLGADSDSSDVVIANPDEGSNSAASKPQKAAGAATKSKQASVSAAPSRIRVMGLALVASLAGAWYILDGNAVTIQATVAAKPGATAAKTSLANPAASGIEQAKSKREARSSLPDATTEDAAGVKEDASKTNSPANSGSAPIELNIQEGTRGEIIPGDAPAGSSSVALSGVTVDAEKPLTAAEFQHAKRQQAMAAMSGRLGQAAAAASGAMAVPAALIPDQEGAEGLAALNRQTSIQKSGMSVSTPLDLPPAIVGPLSLRLAAANGDPSAEFQVGARLAEAKGPAQNFADAAKWYQRSANKGFAQAQYRLGTLYERGLGIKADPAQAQSWYSRAAELGNIKAMHNLAVMSANQSKDSPDYATAARWFSEAAERGLSDSQFNLAVLHENGLGVTQDLKLAYKWLALAARSGDKEAVRRRDILKGKLTADEMVAAEQLIKTWKAKPAEPIANDARSAGEAWKKNPANGISG